MSKVRVSQKRKIQNTLKFSIKNGFLLYLPYEKRNIAKENGFKFLKSKKAWQSKNYSNAYKVINLNQNQGIRVSNQLKNFFKFYGENIWGDIKKIRHALIKIREKCDYAQLEDNRGFSQADKKIGRELILKPKWDNFDILRAAWIVYLHRRQVKEILKD
ncbi:MAG: hypothetical protein QXN68_02800 [Thermoplasmata archaeon]